MWDKGVVKILGFILLTLSFSFYSLEANAQNSRLRKTKQSKSRLKSKQNPRKRKPPIVSFGVLNGKALELVVPEYPSIAKAANIYGIVVVRVLIDEDGNVESADVISGHPLLRASSVKAALQSRFEAFTLSNQPVKASGFINYHFLSNQWNWLEIGYALGKYYSNYYTINDLKDHLPYGFDQEASLIKQLDFSNRETLIEIIAHSIESKLLNDSKSYWLFSVGKVLGNINNQPHDNRLEELDSLIPFAPENVSKTLLSDLIELRSLAKEDPFPVEEFWDKFKDVENKLPTLGK